MGFVLNQADPCVANKVINGKQCTITWYVDDNKLSHMDPQVVTDILEEMEKLYPGLVISRGKKHTLLGMKIEFLKGGSLSIDTSEHVKEAIEDFKEDVTKTVNSAAAHGLFSVDVRADDLGKLFTWIDAAYAVHPDMRSHTGGAMSMGLGVVQAKSSKQKLNTKSSTEAEVVGMSDYTTNNLNYVMFMREQGYEIRENTIYQDNESAIRMEKNGRQSCTSNSKHVDIRYFFVKDRVEKKEIIIEHCPTDKMVADYFTKPLQGALFNKLRRVIMGWDHISTLQKKGPVVSTIEERVGIVSNENKSDPDILKNKTVNASKAVNMPTWLDVTKRNLPKVAVVKEKASQGASPRPELLKLKPQASMKKDGKMKK